MRRGTEKIRKREGSSAIAAFRGDVLIFPAVKNGTGILMMIPYQSFFRRRLLRAEREIPSSEAAMP